MRNFREAYRDSMKELPEFHMEAGDIQDEIRHASFVRRNAAAARHRILARGVTAAALFLVCGVGTVTAMNYRSGIIEVRGNGYSVVSEGTQIVSCDEEGEEVPVCTEEEAVYEEIVECCEPETYDSLESFYAAEDIAAAIPDPQWFDTSFDSQQVMVMEQGEHIMISFSGENASFHMSQWDTRGYEGYASSTAYMGESVNERSFINNQGLDYVMFDTVEDGEITSTHAVISVNGRNLSLDFYGFEEAAIESILNKLDLSVYFRE